LPRALHPFPTRRSSDLVNLDRALAEAEVRSHHLIRLAAGHQGKHFPLARRQRVEPLANAGALTERRAILAIPLQRPLNAVDQILDRKSTRLNSSHRTIS